MRLPLGVKCVYADIWGIERLQGFSKIVNGKM